jgi:hypothetical protein
VLPSSHNFTDLTRLRPADIAGKRVILVRNEYFNVERSDWLKQFSAACDTHTLFTQPPFVISECPRSALPDFLQR